MRTQAIALQLSSASPSTGVVKSYCLAALLTALCLAVFTSVSGQKKDEAGAPLAMHLAEAETDTFKLAVFVWPLTRERWGDYGVVDSAEITIKSGETVIGKGITNTEGWVVIKMPKSAAKGKLDILVGSTVRKTFTPIGRRKRISVYVSIWRSSGCYF